MIHDERDTNLLGKNAKLFAQEKLFLLDRKFLFHLMNFLVGSKFFSLFFFAIIIKVYAKVRINLTACYIVHEIQIETPTVVGNERRKNIENIFALLKFA